MALLTTPSRSSLASKLSYLCFESETMKLACALADRSPAALELGLRAFYRTQDMEFAPQLQFLQAELGRVLALEDAAEGISAFLTKRKPVWKGR